MRPIMLRQVVFRKETFLADLASVIALLAMSLLVIPQSTEAIEARPAKAALILPVFFVVHHQVLCDGRRIDERSTAAGLGAFVVSDVQMRIDMALELTGLREAFGAVAAFMSLLSAVSQHMHLDSLHQFSADWTLRVFAFV